MGIRTDLAVEMGTLTNVNLNGIKKTVKEINGVKLTEIEIKTHECAEKLNRPIGTYITLEYSKLFVLNDFGGLEKLLVGLFKKFFEKKSSILVVGLGNRNISPDAVGPFTVDKIIATRHLNFKNGNLLEKLKLRSVVVLAPGVLAQTGIDSTELIKLVSKNINLDLVVVIDALAARNLNRLGSTIQLTDTGIAPGSGVENKRMELSKKTLNVPVLAIGVPTVVDMSTAAIDFGGKKDLTNVENFMVTSRNIDRIISRSSTLISGSLNRALYSTLSEKELKILAG